MSGPTTLIAHGIPVGNISMKSAFIAFEFRFILAKRFISIIIYGRKEHYYKFTQKTFPY